MTDRLDQIEAQLAENAQQLIKTRKITESNVASMQKTRQLIDSNARAIKTWDDRITEGDQCTQSDLEATIAGSIAMIADLGRQQQATDQRFNVLLAEVRANRTEAREANAAEHQEWQRRFDEAMATNAAEHRAFIKTFQSQLAQIAQLWQQVS